MGCLGGEVPFVWRSSTASETLACPQINVLQGYGGEEEKDSFTLPLQKIIFSIIHFL